MNDATNRTPEVVLFGFSLAAGIAAVYERPAFAIIATVLAFMGQIFRTIRTSPRTLSDKKRARLADALRHAMPSNLVMEYEDGDPESTSYTIKIREAFNEARVVIDSRPKSFREPKQSGLTILVRDISQPPAEAQRLLVAFSSARISIAFGERDSLFPLNLVLSIGQKPLIHWKGIANCIRFHKPLKTS